jgi:hypothetical protein
MACAWVALGTVFMKIMSADVLEQNKVLDIADVKQFLDKELGPDDVDDRGCSEVYSSMQTHSWTSDGRPESACRCSLGSSPAQIRLGRLISGFWPRSTIA